MASKFPKKLPTVQTFGARPTVRPQRGIRRVRTGLAETAEAKGLREINQATAEAGAAVGEAVAEHRERIANEEADMRLRRLTPADPAVGLDAGRGLGVPGGVPGNLCRE